MDEIAYQIKAKPDIEFGNKIIRLATEEQIPPETFVASLVWLAAEIQQGIEEGKELNDQRD
jgi:hypothetical protein